MARRDIVKPADSATLYSSGVFARPYAALLKLPREEVHPTRTKSARAFIVHPRQLLMRYVPFFIRQTRIPDEGKPEEPTSLTNVCSYTRKRTSRNGMARRPRAPTNSPDVIFQGLRVTVTMQSVSTSLNCHDWSQGSFAIFETSGGANLCSAFQSGWKWDRCTGVRNHFRADSITWNQADVVD